MRLPLATVPLAVFMKFQTWTRHCRKQTSCMSSSFAVEFIKDEEVLGLNFQGCNCNLKKKIYFKVQLKTTVKLLFNLE